MKTTTGNYPRGPRPHVWQTGPDPVRHAQHTAWSRSRAQAHFRGETWALSFAQYEAVWADQWHRRSRLADGIMLMRKNWRLPWSVSNVDLVTREVFHQRQQQIKLDRKKLNDKKI